MSEIDLQQAEKIAPLLGQDFLTWLWYQSEKGEGIFYSQDAEPFSFSLQKRLVVQGGDGETKDTAVCSGPQSEFREAKLGLRTGKKVNQAKLQIEQDVNAWEVQLKAEDFSFAGLRTPRVDMQLEEGEDPDSRYLEKIFLIEKCLEFIDVLYSKFLQIRFSSQWEAEVRQIREWIFED